VEGEIPGIGGIGTTSIAGAICSIGVTTGTTSGVVIFVPNAMRLITIPLVQVVCVPKVVQLIVSADATLTINDMIKAIVRYKLIILAL
jgi:hypothetical protein